MKQGKWGELIVTSICHILVLLVLIQTTVFAETLPDTKQVRGGTNYSLTAEGTGSEQPQTKDKLHDEETLALLKSELIDSETNATSQTAREKIKAPNLTYRYGFINEEGQPVNANEILLQYHSWQGGSPDDINVQEGGSQPMVASIVASLKEAVTPSRKVAIYSDMSAVLAASNQTFFLPRYYASLSSHNKKGGIDPNYPLPTISGASGNQYPATISQSELEKMFA